MTTKRVLAAIFAIACVVGAAMAQDMTKVANAGTGTVAAPASVPVAPLVTIDEVKKDVDGGKKIVFLDSRPGLQAEMIKGSTQVTLDKVDAWAAADGKNLPKDTEIVTYCGCGAEQGSKALAEKLIALGYTNVHALKGGINSWRGAGLPTEPGKPQ